MRSIVLFVLFIVYSSAYADEIAIQQDPYEKFNRSVFSFNDTLDTYILKPVAIFYNKVMPKPLNRGVHNFFNNINELPTLANDFLQLNFYQGANDFSRLAINTTIGIGGLFDMATRMKLPYYTNDFGMTLGHWGYKQSSYVVFPFFASGTIRDGIGWPIDYYAFSIYPYIHPLTAQYGLYALNVVDRRVQWLAFEPVMDAAGIDKYTFIRNAYMQRRAYQIEQTFHRGVKDQLSSQLDNKAA